MFELPDLGYSFDALEPHIDANTMEIHHGKHHAAYIEKLNTALKDHSDLQSKNVEELLSDIKALPEEIRTAVQNNGGGHLNHTLFWETMKPGGASQPDSKLTEALNKAFGSVEDLKAKINEAGITRFGSGWSWLVDNRGTLEIYSTANQDSPIMENKKPLLGVDVWEHAYYLKYQNRRPDYLTAWWNVVNWDVVSKRFSAV